MEIFGTVLAYLWLIGKIIFLLAVIYIAVKEIKKYRKKDENDGDK